MCKPPAATRSNQLQPDISVRLKKYSLFFVQPKKFFIAVQHSNLPGQHIRSPLQIIFQRLSHNASIATRPQLYCLAGVTCWARAVDEPSHSSCLSRSCGIWLHAVGVPSAAAIEIVTLWFGILSWAAEGLLLWYVQLRELFTADLEILWLGYIFKNHNQNYYYASWINKV